MNNIISSQQVENSSIIINCGIDQGTGFYVTEDILLTARHVIEECIDSDEDIIINKEIYDSGSILSASKELDLCLIKTKKKVDNYLPLVSASSSFNQPCSVFGFPYLQDLGGNHFHGRVDKIGVDTHWDFSVFCKDVDDDINYDGLSGGAIISNSKVVGIALIQKGKSILAISVRRAFEFLNQAQILISKDESLNEIPIQLKNEVEESTTNYSVVEDLTVKLQENNGWFLCFGSPGSGKTTFSAAFNPEDDSIKVCGRYFTKIPHDNIPTAIRTSNRKLISWFEASISEVMGVPIDVIDKFEDRIKRIPSLFEELSEENSEFKCVFIIDGLDEVDDLQTFLGILPEELPLNISIVLSCTSFDILPPRVKRLINGQRTIEVIPLDIGQCEAYLREQLENQDITTEAIQEIALKSEGHPLYLQYLINYLKTSEINSDELDVWINEIPSIGGKISEYYEVIWQNFFKEESKLWIVIILAQVRSYISQDDLIKMIPQEYRLSFYSNFAPISYLFKGVDKVELYHASFKEYISLKVPSFIPLANDNISEFCIEHDNQKYSIDNALYHLTLSSDPSKALINCNQDWADTSTFEHVNPDLVIQDIKRVIDVALKRADAIELIRLLLLLQRMEFRYDSVFAENAKHLASALIAMGKYSASMKYLVRDNTLLINDEDVIYFLQLLYESNAVEEGDALLKAFNKRFRHYIQEEFRKSGERISLTPFIDKVRALSLSLSSNRDESIDEIMNVSENLVRFRNAAGKDGLNEIYESFDNVRKVALGWFTGYMLRIYGSFEEAKEISKRDGITLDSEWTKMKAYSLLFYNEFNKKTYNRIEKDDSYYKTVVDTEWLIDNYGYDDSWKFVTILINALINDSKRIDIVEELIEKYLISSENKSFELRHENGVDLNYIKVDSFYFNHMCEGYRMKQKTFPSLPSISLRYESWEDFYLQIVENLGLLEGRLIKNRIKEIEDVDLFSRLKRIVLLINLKLSERVRWDRSYHLPEALLPIIFDKISHLFMTYYESSSKWLVDHIRENSKYQLGLYSEGYRECLVSIIQMFLKFDKNDLGVVSLIGLFENHVLECVQNRWERTPELIRVIEFYSIVGESDKADLAFKEMLRTSMGPSWYKEAQLQLLNTTVRLNSDIKSVNNYAVKVASLLDSASGEMTFQRYIRYEKENFIGDLISKGNVDKAIEYLKFETIPPADILLENAENSKVDIVEKGFGNSPGARNLTIQNGVLELLNIEGLSPFIRIALCRIFTVNDDIFRHVDIFSIKMATALNEIEDEKQRIFVFGYIVEIISASEMAEDKKAYITQLYQTLHADIYEELYQYVDCEDVDLKLPSLKVKDEILKKNHQKEEGKNWFEVFNSKRFENLNKSSRSDLANFGVEAFKKERISIWHSNWSTPSNVAKDNLKELFSDVDDTLINLYPFVRNYGVETWTVVDQLIWFLEGKLSSEQGERILADISDHFELLIRPEKSIFQKYEWFNKSVDQSNTSDKKVLNFIIWLLNHPLEWIRNGAFKVIESLFEFLPDELISELIKESISDTAVVSCETSVELLCRLACGSSEKIIKVFNEDPELVSLISNVNHLTIFKKYLELGEKLKSHGYSDLFNSLHMSLPDDIEGDSEVALEEDMLDPIVYEIEALNELQILNREFCENILYRIREKCKPLTWSEYQKTDMYMKRSYNEERFYSGGYSELARYALNKAIVSRVGKNNIEDIYNAINSI